MYSRSRVTYYLYVDSDMEATMRKTKTIVFTVEVDVLSIPSDKAISAVAAGLRESIVEQMAGVLAYDLRNVREGDEPEDDDAKVAVRARVIR